MLRNHRFLPLFLLICFALVPLAGEPKLLEDALVAVSRPEPG